MASIYATGSKGHHKFTLTVTETGTSKVDNTSAVAFSLVMSPVITGYGFKLWGNDLTYKIVIDGVEYTGNLPDYGGSGTVTVKSGTQMIAHNADGTKTLAFGFAVSDVSGVSYTPGNASAEGSVDLTRILRNPPTLTASVEDSNLATLALTGDPGKLIRYFSNAAFTLGAEAHDGATIVERYASCGGKTLSGVDGVFENTESGSFTFTATDSYGNSASETVELPMIPYIPLTCDLAPTKPDAEGNMTVSVSGNCFQGSFGAAENALAVFIRYRETSGSFGDWVALTVNQTGNSYTATGDLTGLDYQKAYGFQAKAEDLLDTTETPEYTAKAIPVFDWGENDFNVNGMFKMNGTPVADFIVEQNTDGIWNYRKWNSGVAECWGETDCKISWMGNNPAYYSTTKLYSVFPAQFFVSEPVVCVSATNSNSAYVVPCVTTVSEEGVSLVFGRFYGGTDDVSAKVKMYAIGNWKEEDL